MTIEAFILSIVSGGAGAGILTWLLRAWISERLKQSIKSEYDIKLESYKSQLKKENDLYVNELKSKYEETRLILSNNLELAKLEHQIKYSGSYNELLLIIKDIHSILIKIHASISSYVSIFESTNGPSKEERRVELRKLLDEFWKSYNSKRIFFTEELDKEIVEYIKIVRSKGLEFMLKVEQEKSKTTHEDWARIDTEVNDQWETILKSIRTQFRNILGVNKYNNQELTEPAGAD